VEHQGGGLPDIVTYRIPRIEVYQVTDDELARIEEGSGRVAQDLSFALAAGSIFGTLVVALLTGTFKPSIGAALTIAALVFGLAAIYTGARWWRERERAPNVIAAIRRRKVDPQPTDPHQ
jgi:hypothetical protein